MSVNVNHVNGIVERYSVHSVNPVRADVLQSGCVCLEHKIDKNIVLNLFLEPVDALRAARMLLSSLEKAGMLHRLVRELDAPTDTPSESKVERATQTA